MDDGLHASASPALGSICHHSIRCLETVAQREFRSPGVKFNERPRGPLANLQLFHLVGYVEERL